jgi:hypothetical protein
MLSVCGKTGAICKLSSDGITPLVVNDFYVAQGRCEEGARCLHYACPLNKTTMASLKAGTGHRVKKLTPLPINGDREQLAWMREQFTPEGERGRVVVNA